MPEWDDRRTSDSSRPATVSTTMPSSSPRFCAADCPTLAIALHRAGPPEPVGKKPGQPSAHLSRRPSARRARRYDTKGTHMAAMTLNSRHGLPNSQRSGSHPPTNREAPEPVTAKTKSTRDGGALGYLARSTRHNARTEGMVFAAHELFRMESLLWAFRAQLLATPVALRGPSDDAVLSMLEMLIQREATSRSTARGKAPQPAQSTAAGVRSGARDVEDHGPRGHGTGTAPCARRHRTAPGGLHRRQRRVGIR